MNAQERIEQIKKAQEGFYLTGFDSPDFGRFPAIQMIEADIPWLLAYIEKLQEVATCVRYEYAKAMLVECIRNLEEFEKG